MNTMMTIILCTLIIITVNSFQLLSNHHYHHYHHNHNHHRHDIIMRDGSSRAVFFQIGDRVKVIEDVIHNPPNSITFNSKGLEGVVKDIWEKCEIGHHCHCHCHCHHCPCHYHH